MHSKISAMWHKALSATMIRCLISKLCDKFVRVVPDQMSWQVWEDFLTVRGFLHALCMILRCEVRAFCWLAPACASVSWMSRSRTLRSAAWPEGEPIYVVRQGNIMLARCMLIIRLCFAKSMVWCLEQPLTASTRFCARFQEVLRECGAYTRTIKLCEFGADTKKPLQSFLI